MTSSRFWPSSCLPICPPPAGKVKSFKAWGRSFKANIFPKEIGGFNEKIWGTWMNNIEQQHVLTNKMWFNQHAGFSRPVEAMKLGFGPDKELKIEQTRSGFARREKRRAWGHNKQNGRFRHPNQLYRFYLLKEFKFGFEEKTWRFVKWLGLTSCEVEAAVPVDPIAPIGTRSWSRIGG